MSRRLNLPRLAWRYLWATPWMSALNLLLLSLGLAAMGFVILVGEQLEAGLRRDLAGIDLVVGAKGSPMQIMLSGVFHLDPPTGNIPLDALAALRRQPLVARAVPISVGDSLRGYRIVGTEPDFLALYQAQLAQGALWLRPLEAVLGHEAARATGLRVGDRFQGTHGLGERGDAHEQGYRVVGILQPQGGVLDRLVLTDLRSVWVAHGQALAPADEPARPGDADHGAPGQDDPEEHDGHDGHADHGPVTPATAHGGHAAGAPLEVSMALVTYRGPLGAALLPRWVNAQPGLQAAVPALETARLLRMLGVGVDVLRGFAAVLLLAAALSVFVALLHTVRERQPDLAMMRLLGATPGRVAALVALEATALALLASALAWVLAHGAVQALGWALARQQSLRLDGLWLSAWEWLVPLAALALALLAAAWPAWRAYRLDVTELLQGARG